MTDHLDLEALSAVLDGELESRHVEGCASCRGRLAELRLARDEVARPVPPVGDEAREHVIARALAAASAEAGPGTSLPVRELRPRRNWWLGGSAAAAALVVVVGAVALVGSLGRSTSDDTATSGFDATTGAETAAGPVPTDSALHAGDLGDVASVEVLRARVAAGRVAAEGAAPSTGGALAATAEPGVPAPRQVGTRVCEAEARTARPQLGFVVYAANLRFQGTPAVVLGFAATPSGPPETLLVLAPEQGCRPLAETRPS